MNVIGKKIQMLRKERNITQEQLANELHTAKSTIGMWENGRRIPDLDTIRRIADFFNKSVEYITNEYIEINQVLHEDRVPETKCPICGYDYIHFIKTVPVKFPNEKSSGICLQFECEAEHCFYLIIEDYKGNSYMAYLDENFEQIENIELSYNNEFIGAKYNKLDSHGKDMVDTVLEKEYQRCNEKNITLSDYTQNIAAGTGEDGFTDTKINEVNDFAKQIYDLENDTD